MVAGQKKGLETEGATVAMRPGGVGAQMQTEGRRRSVRRATEETDRRVCFSDSGR